MMAATAVRGSLENVTTNLESIDDGAYVKRVRDEVLSLASRITQSPVSAGR